MRKNLKKIKNAHKAKAYKRKLSIRKTVFGTIERPRICATKSNSNMYIQVIDDVNSKTLFSACTFGKNKVDGGCSSDGAKNLAKVLGEKFKANNITKAVFDRNGGLYTGVIKTLADSIREEGITI